MLKQSFTTPGHIFRQARSSGPLEIAYTVFSRPKQADSFTVVFCHGSQLCKELWNYYVEQLAAKLPKIAKIITIDAANSGESARLNEGRVGYFNAWQDLAKDNIKVLEDVQRRSGDLGPIIVVGHSMGGSEALFMANLEPSLFAGIVAMDPVWGVFNSFASSAVVERVGDLSRRVSKGTKAEFASETEYREWMGKRFASRTFHPRIKKDVEDASFYEHNGRFYLKAAPVLQAGAYGSACSMANHSVTTLKYTPMPVLVMHGDVDDWNPPESNQELAKMLPNGEEAVVPGGGHLVFFTEPDATIKRIVPFFKKALAEWNPIVPDFDDLENSLTAFVSRASTVKSNL